MNPKEKLTVAVIFGSRSVEHEVSVVTAMQVFENIDRSKYKVIPVYIDKKGLWWTGKALEKLEGFRDLNLISQENLHPCFLDINKKTLTIGVLGPIHKNIQVDIFFPAMHGTYGEDGTLQGLFEMANIPFAGSGVTGSAVGMDKIIQKAVFEREGIPVVKYKWFTRERWEKERKEIIKEIEKSIPYPIFVKPANLGSSVGITKAKNTKGLIQAIEIAKEFDCRVLAEEGIENAIEINCSVLGNLDVVASVCEQPIKGKDILSYEDKYLKGGKVKGMAGLSRLVPAPISETLTKKIQEISKKAFVAVDAGGISRIDFLVHPKSKKVYINEINTIPGSLSFYLWEKSGFPFTKLIDKLIELGLERHKNRSKNTVTYDSNLLKTVGRGGKN